MPWASSSLPGIILRVWEECRGSGFRSWLLKGTGLAMPLRLGAGAKV